MLERESLVLFVFAMSLLNLDGEPSQLLAKLDPALMKGNSPCAICIPTTGISKIAPITQQVVSITLQATFAACLFQSRFFVSWLGYWKSIVSRAPIMSVE